MTKQINKKLFEDIETKLNDDGYNAGSTHPVWVLYNTQDEIIKGLDILERVEYYSKLFPENQLLKDLLNDGKGEM